MKRALAVVLSILSLLVLAAHFYRAGALVLAVAGIVLIGLVTVSRPWAVQSLRVVLLLGAIEWLRTAWGLATHRAAVGQPYLRMVAILGTVAAMTLLAAFLARHLDRRSEVDAG